MQGNFKTGLGDKSDGVRMLIRKDERAGLLRAEIMNIWDQSTGHRGAPSREVQSNKCKKLKRWEGGSRDQIMRGLAGYEMSGFY